MDRFGATLRMGMATATVVMVSLIAVPGHAARWYEDYLIAVEKIEAGGCSEEAINYLGAAIIDKPKPRRSARTIAAQRIDYLPYYQLVRAHLACGNLKNARENLEKSRHWGVADSRDLDRLEELIRRAEESIAVTPTPVPVGQLQARSAAAKNSILNAEEALRACDASLGTATQRGIHNPDWTTRRGKAASLLQRARESLHSGASSGDLLLLADADRLAKEAALVAAELRRNADTTLETIRTPTPTPTPVPAPSPTPTPRQMVPPPGPTPFVLPDHLRRAAELYFLRDYKGTLRLLDPLDDGPPPVRAAELLLRGAARLALSRTEPDSAEELRTAGTRDLARARRLAPLLRPDPRFFPPWLLKAWAGAE